MGRKDHTNKTREIVRRLEREGWYAVGGKGDHVNYKHPAKPGRVTIDKGSREQTTVVLRSIHRQAGWNW